MAALSEAERRFLSEGLVEGVRSDGRALGDWRSFAVETDVLPHVHGSCRVQLGAGGATDVLAAVKAQVAAPHAQRPAQGMLDIAVDVSPVNFARKRATAGGAGVRADEAELVAELSHILRTLMAGGGTGGADAGGDGDGDGENEGNKELCLRALCIAEGKFVWQIYVDILVVQDAGGNALDAASFAAYVALNRVRLPAVKTVLGEGGVVTDFDVVQDSTQFSPLLGAEYIPIVCTVCCHTPLAEGQDEHEQSPADGSLCYLDPTTEEESICNARILVAVDRTGSVCGIHKDEHGPITFGDIASAIHLVTHSSASVFAGLDTVLARAEEDARRRPDMPLDRVSYLGYDDNIGPAQDG